MVGGMCARIHHQALTRMNPRFLLSSLAITVGNGFSRFQTHFQTIIPNLKFPSLTQVYFPPLPIPHPAPPSFVVLLPNLSTSLPLPPDTYQNLLLTSTPFSRATLIRPLPPASDLGSSQFFVPSPHFSCFFRSPPEPRLQRLFCFFLYAFVPLIFLLGFWA